jgi:hypothetical protein
MRQAYLGDIRTSSLGWAIVSIVLVGVATQLLIMQAERKVARAR